jgi:hypothetical protein
MANKEDPKLDRSQIALIGGEGLLSLTPVIGSALAKFTFGVLTERRINRIEKTLAEVVEAVGDDVAKEAVNENFVNLLENVCPELSRAVDEEKRLRFRDLLINAAKLPKDSLDWGASKLAADLLKEIDTPGLVILAAFSHLDEGETALLTAYPVPQLLRGVKSRDFDPENPGEPQHVIPYDWDVVEYWYRRLADLRLVIRGAHGKDTYEGVRLYDLGEFLVKWVLA